MCLPRIRSRVPPDALVLAASLGTSAVVAGLALVQTLLAAVPLMLIGGAFWVTVLSTLNVAAQVTLPNWVKARGLSIYFVAFNGGLALGSPLWGLVAGYAGVPLALIASAVGLALASVAVLRWRLPPMESPDLSPSMHWPTPLVAIGDLDHRHGPVMVQLEYRIASDRHDAFLTALAELGRIRRRDGAISWNHLVDAADPVRHVETFYLETWLEHLRQHDRVTVADRELQDKVRAFHLGTDPPRVSHLVPVRHLRHPS
jgi:hypothetical protein